MSEIVPIGDGEVVDEWRCRACGQLVPATRAADETLAMFNKALAARGEQSIDPNECVFCDRCGVQYRRKRAARAQEIQTKLTEHIKALSDSGTPAHLLGEAEQFVSKFANEGPDIVSHLAAKRRNQRGASAYEVLLAIVFLPCVLVVLLLALGYSLDVDFDKLATARTWKQKRREMNASIEARKVRS